MKRQLAKLKTLSDEAHLVIWQLIDACPPNRVLILGPCRLPPECTPTHVEVGFFKDGPHYCIGVKPAFHYTGDNAAIKALSKAQMLPFDSYYGAVLEAVPRAGRYPRTRSGYWRLMNMAAFNRRGQERSRYAKQ